MTNTGHLHVHVLYRQDKCSSSALCSASAGQIQDAYVMHCIGRNALSNQDIPPKQLHGGGSGSEKEQQRDVPLNPHSLIIVENAYHAYYNKLIKNLFIDAAEGYV